METELNDIDIMLKNMAMAETSIVGDSNVEKCNLQVASTHQTEEGNKEHKDLYQRKLEEIEDDIVTDGVVTFGVRGSKENDEFTDGPVTDGDGGSKDNDEFTDGPVTDGDGGSKDNDDKEISDGKETGDTDTVVKEVKEGIETEVTNSIVTGQGGQGTEREQHVEEVSDKNVTVRVAEFTETNAMKEIRDNTYSSDTEPLTENDDDRDSTDSTDNTEGAVTIDEDFSKVCSTCPSNPESSSSSSSNEKESDAENKV